MYGSNPRESGNVSNIMYIAERISMKRPKAPTVDTSIRFSVILNGEISSFDDYNFRLSLATLLGIPVSRLQVSISR